MTVAEMLTILGDRMEDSSGTLYDDTTKYRYLNRAQARLMRLVPYHNFTELHVLKTGVTLSTDNDVDSHFKYYFTPTLAGDLDSDPYGGAVGILGIRVNNGSFTKKISFEIAKDFTTGLVGFSGTDPVYFIFKGRVYIYNTSTTVDVYYMKEPAQMGASQECELNSVYHDAILEFAEAELWRTVNNRDRMATAEAKAYEYIAQYNQHSATDFVGAGYSSDFLSNAPLVDPIYPNYPID